MTDQFEMFAPPSARRTRGESAGFHAKVLALRRAGHRVYRVSTGQLRIDNRIVDLRQFARFARRLMQEHDNARQAQAAS